MPPDADIERLEEKLEGDDRAVVTAMRVALVQLSERIQRLTETNQKLKRMLWGPRSEKLPPMAQELQRQLDDEKLAKAPADNDNPTAPPDSNTDLSEEERKRRERNRRKQGRKRSEVKRAKRRNDKRKLPMVVRQVHVTAEQLPEGYSLEDFRPVGDGKIVRRYDHVKSHILVTEFVLNTVASKDGLVILTPPVPDSVVEGGQYGPGLYAHVVVSKCDDAMPLYRQERAFVRTGFAIPRSTLCDLFHRAAELLKPVYDRLLLKVRHHPYVAADETTLPVQHPGGCKNGWLWTFLCESAITYVFSNGRKGYIPTELLQSTEGYLQIDGASLYDQSCDPEKGRTRVGCWSHCRRAFFEALSSSPELARRFMALILALYRVEYLVAEQGQLGTDMHLEARQHRSKEIVDELFELVAKERPNHPPQSPIGKALTYAHNQQESLRTFLSDPKLRLDNNLSENALRIIALGRKNFLFVGHEVAGKNLAILQSIVATCKLHGVDPYDYLRDVLPRLGSHPQSEIDEILPDRWKPQKQEPPP